MTNADTVRQTIDQGSVFGLPLRVAVLCFTINILDGFDVLAIAFTAPAISDEWGLKQTELGLVFSMGILGMALGALFIGALADTFGRRKIILFSIALAGIATAATGTSSSMGDLIAFRLITGLGIGGMLASLTTMVAEYAPERRRNLLVSFLHVGYPVGTVIGGFIAKAMIPVSGWQSVFYAGGILTAIMIPIVLVLLPESLDFLLAKQPKNALSKINKILAKMQAPPLDELPPLPEARPKAPFVALMGPHYRKRTLLLGVSVFMALFTLYFLLSWIPTIVVDAGLDFDKAVIAGVILNAGGAVGMLLVGYISAKLSLRRLIITFFLIGSAGMAVFGAQIGQTTPNVLLVLTGILGFFVLGGYIGLYSVAARIYPAEIRTTGVGWAVGFGRLGAIAGPSVGGLLMSLGYSRADYFMLLGAPLVLAAFLLWLIRAPEIEAPVTH